MLLGGGCSCQTGPCAMSASIRYIYHYTHRSKSNFGVAWSLLHYTMLFISYSWFSLNNSFKNNLHITWPVLTTYKSSSIAINEYPIKMLELYICNFLDSFQDFQVPRISIGFNLRQQVFIFWWEACFSTICLSLFFYNSNSTAFFYFVLSFSSPSFEFSDCNKNKFLALYENHKYPCLVNIPEAVSCYF